MFTSRGPTGSASSLRMSAHVPSLTTGCRYSFELTSRMPPTKRRSASATGPGLTSLHFHLEKCVRGALVPRAAKRRGLRPEPPA